MEKKIFISYSHQDSNCALGIARYLGRHGYNVWVDSDKLSLGKSWSSDIDEALNSSDIVIAILSASSLRRKEVLREIGIALERMNKEGIENFRLFFVVIGHIHQSWFGDKEASKDIIDYLTRYQYIQLSAYGEVTIEAMKELVSAIKKQGIESGNLVLTDNDDYYDTFINQNSIPEKAFDNQGNNVFYKVYPADLSESCYYPFAMDNQWLSEEMYDPSTSIYDRFEWEGFTNEEVKDYVEEYRRRNFLLSFFHAKQIIIKRNSLIYSSFFRHIIDSEGTDKEAFIKLLMNGSIVVFLYGKNEFTPFIHFSTSSDDTKTIENWNKICEETSIYCIRENWSTHSDMHGIEFLRFCSNLAIDRNNNILLANNMHLSPEKIDEFLTTLKTISMQAFCQTHMNGTEGKGKVDAYSRSMFYKNYIVRNYDTLGRDPVAVCLYDPNKPFHHQLKKLIDIYYNSIFTNCFQCKALLPDDVRPENFFLHYLYLNHGEKEVSIEELQYAFSEFFENCEILDEIEAMGGILYLKYWDLPKVVELRRKESWMEYVELLEMINRRSNHWKVDFNEIELLMQRFLKCFEGEEKLPMDSKDLAYTFRVCIGSKVLDIVKTMKVGKIKEYGGAFSENMQAPLKIQFSIGDLSRDSAEDLISLPVILFDGMIDTVDAESFFSSLKNFIIRQFDFVKVD